MPRAGIGSGRPSGRKGTSSSRGCTIGDDQPAAVGMARIANDAGEHEALVSWLGQILHARQRDVLHAHRHPRPLRRPCALG
ncbi:MAG: hypothetical protein ACLUNV_06720 [Sutterella wadsworthensis]